MSCTVTDPPSIRLSEPRLAESLDFSRPLPPAGTPLRAALHFTVSEPHMEAAEATHLEALAPSLASLPDELRSGSQTLLIAL